MGSFVAGNKLRLQETFTDSNNALLDPTNVSLKYSTPAVAAVTKNYPADITRDSLGVYHYDLDLTGLLGRLTVEWITTGTGQATEPHFHDITAAPL